MSAAITPPDPELEALRLANENAAKLRKALAETRAEVLAGLEMLGINTAKVNAQFDRIEDLLP